jgi:uncharacterized protein YeaO (DUF488 family)
MGWIKVCEANSLSNGDLIGFGHNSKRLRRWFGHDAKKWDEFKDRYFDELDRKRGSIDSILSKAKGGSVTLLYGAKEEEFNNAVALKQYLQQKIRK